jgi:hypothetical protein
MVEKDLSYWYTLLKEPADFFDALCGIRWGYLKDVDNYIERNRLRDNPTKVEYARYIASFKLRPPHLTIEHEIGTCFDVAEVIKDWANFYKYNQTQNVFRLKEHPISVEASHSYVFVENSEKKELYVPERFSVGCEKHLLTLPLNFDRKILFRYYQDAFMRDRKTEDNDAVQLLGLCELPIGATLSKYIRACSLSEVIYVPSYPELDIDWIERQKYTPL